MKGDHSSRIAIIKDILRIIFRKMDDQLTAPAKNFKLQFLEKARQSVRADSTWAILEKILGQGKTAKQAAEEIGISHESAERQERNSLSSLADIFTDYGQLKALFDEFSRDPKEAKPAVSIAVPSQGESSTESSNGSISSEPNVSLCVIRIAETGGELPLDPLRIDIRELLDVSAIASSRLRFWEDVAARGFLSAMGRESRLFHDSRASITGIFHSLPEGAKSVIESHFVLSRPIPDIALDLGLSRNKVSESVSLAKRIVWNGYREEVMRFWTLAFLHHGREFLKDRTGSAFVALFNDQASITDDQETAIACAMADILIAMKNG